MKRIFLLISLLYLLVISGNTQVTVSIDTSQKKQRITALGSGANGPVSPANLPLLINDLGSAALLIPVAPSYEPGLEMAANDNADYNNADTSKFHWSQNALNLAAEAKKLNIKILISCWSPPIWMKDTTKDMYVCAPMECTNSAENGGNLAAGMYNEFAEWAYGSLLKFKQQSGYDAYAFSPQTEPEFKEPYCSCVYTADELMRATRVTGRKLDSAGLNTRLHYGEILFAQFNELNFFKAVNNDSVCKNYVDAFDLHIADDDGLNVTGSGVTSYRYQLSYNECQRVIPKKEFWMEMDSYVPTTNPPMDDAVLEACRFYNGMYYGNLNLWLYCHYNNNPLNDLKVYYLYKQLIRFIRPYSVRLQSSSDDNKLFTLVFQNDSEKSYNITLINTDPVNDKTVNIALPGSPANFDVFCTSIDYNCDWTGQTSLTGIKVPAKSILTLVSSGENKLPVITVPDTIVIIKNSGLNTIDLTGISDGGEGNQPISISATVPPSPALLTSMNITYTSPGTTGKLNLTPGPATGQTVISMIIDDSSKAMNGFFSKKFLHIPLYVIPFINKAPTMNDIPDQVYPKSTINAEQLIIITGVTDGNDGTQQLTLTAVSSIPNAAIIKTQGSTVIKIIPKAEATITVTVTLKDDGGTFLNGSNFITKTFTVKIGNGIFSSENHDELNNIYPNPASGYFTIKNPGLKFSHYSIVDAEGKVVMEGSLPDETNYINTGNLYPGTYLVKTENGNEISINKLMLTGQFR